MFEAQAGGGTQRSLGPHLTGSSSPVAGHRERLLVVHSYRSLREAIAQTLRHHRYEVLESASADDASALLAVRTPALLLVELVAGTDAIDTTAAELARAARDAGATVLGLASHPLEEGESDQLGIDEILVMPVEQRRLLATVDRVLGPAMGEAASVCGGEDPQCRLALEDRLRAEHLSLSFTYPDVTRIALTPANDGRVRTFAGRLAALGIDPEVRIEGTDLLFRYEISIADALLLEEEGEEEQLHGRLIAAFSQLRARPAALHERIRTLASELRRLQRLAS